MGMSAFSAHRRTSAIVSGEGLGVVNRTSWSMYRGVAAGMSLMLPTIGTPTRVLPCTVVSSSKTATGINPALG